MSDAVVAVTLEKSTDAAYRDRRWLGRAALVVAAITLLRLVSLWFNATDLFFDEAQYWFWGTEPAFGYFSKPPLLGWIIGAFTAVCGDSEFCVRLPSPLLHAVTAMVVYLLGERLFGARTGFWSALLYITVPAVSLSSTLISTDVPLLLFWALALYAFVRMEEAGGGILWAAVLGLALGGGLMSKYAMIYFLPCALIYAGRVRFAPHFLGRPQFWLALGIAALCVSPNLWWNVQNGFVTASHTGENMGWGASFPNLRGLLEFFASQFAVFGPVAFGILLAAWWRLPSEGLMNRRQWFLIAFSLPILVLICLQALLSKAYANWAALAYVAGTVLIADLMVNTIPEHWRRLTLSLHLGAMAVIAVGVMFAGRLPLPDNMQPFERMQGASDIAAAARRQLDGHDYAAILTDDRRLSALMAYYLRDVVAPRLAWSAGAEPRDHFEMTHAFAADPRTPALYITRFRNPAEVVRAFADVELMGRYKPPAGEIRQVWFYALRDYRGAEAKQ